MNHFGDIIYKVMKEKNSALVVGLDPNPSLFPNFLKCGSTTSEIGETIYQFNKIVIDHVVEYAVAIKPQLAYYEIFGSEGLKALEKTISYAKSNGVIIINDGKRNDIGSTASAYAEAFLGEMPLSGDALTVNPYLGSDGIKPFITKAQANGKGIFALLKTSNPSSGELQDLVLASGNPLYLKLADQLNVWSEGTIGARGYSSLGAVVGATYPEVAIKLRETLPNTIFLVPGFGAQGATAEELTPFFDNEGFGALINSARGIIYAYQKDEENWAEFNEKQMGASIQAAASIAQEQINRVRFVQVNN
jgi:orotidine-5'-phosphate decarboxylase